jgi:hypothetical protein
MAHRSKSKDRFGRASRMVAICALPPSRVAAPHDRNPPLAMFRRRIDQRSTPAQGGLLPPDDAPERPVSASEPSLDAFAGTVLVGFDCRAVCNLLKWFHNHYYANHICGTKGSDIDDARGPAPGLQEHDSAGALASKEGAAVSSIFTPSPLWFRIGRAGPRSSRPPRWEGEAARMGS